MIYAVVTLIAIIAAVNAKIYFKEDFNDAAWEKRWVVPSEWKSKVKLRALMTSVLLSSLNGIIYCV